jgi:hypothetical protein
MMLTPTDMLIIGMVLASLACLRRKRCGGVKNRTNRTDGTYVKMSKAQDEIRRAQNDLMIHFEIERKAQP